MLSTKIFFQNSSGMDNNNNNINNNSSSINTSVDVLKDSLPLTATFIVMYVILFLIGVSGNALVVYVVMRNKAMQTITNIFITNLAISDIMMCLLAVPFTPFAYFMNTWIFGKLLCHIVPMTLGICVYVSTLTSTAIAVDRHFVIVYPFKPRMKTCVCLIMIVAIWFISVSISLPLGIYQEIKPDRSNPMMQSCQENWPKQQAQQFFTVTSLVLQYIVPCSIITYCYLKVSLALRKRSKSRIGSGSANPERGEIEIRRKRRTNKMLIAMVTIFVCCWLPLNMILLVGEYNRSFNSTSFHALLFLTAHVIAMSSTIYNPFLYAWMNDNFKKEFKLVLPCVFRRASDRNDNGSYTQYTHVETNPSVSTNKSPQKESNYNEHAGETKAYFEADSQKVHLNVEDDCIDSD